MRRIAGLAGAAAALGFAALTLTACTSGSPDDEPAGGTAAPGVVETSTEPTTPAAEAELTIVDRIAQEYPDEDWEPADSPALAMTADEREEYLRIAGAEIAESFDSEGLLADDNAEGLTAEQNDALTAMAEALTRAGRDAMLVSMIVDSDAGDLDQAAAALEYGWNVCLEVEAGASYGEAFGEAFADAIGAAMVAGLETDEEAAAEAEADATAAMIGTLFAYLQCPQFADEAMEAISEMG